MDPDGSNQTNISNHPGFEEHPAWSPDGNKIAFTRRPAGAGPADIWVMNPDGSSQVNLTPSRDIEGELPSWSPDGTKIAFSTVTSVKILNLSDLTVTDLNILGGGPIWSPDGGRIAFTGYTDPPGIPNVYIMNAGGSNPVNIGHPATGQGPSYWSPDGKKIAFTESNTGEFSVIEECGGNRVKLTHLTSDAATSGIDPAWSPDGSKIAFWSNNDLAVMNADGSERQVLANDVYFGGVDWQPLVQTAPSPVPRSHACVPLVATPAASPAPVDVPNPLPVAGGKPSGGSSTSVATLVTGMAIMFISIAITRRSRNL